MSGVLLYLADHGVRFDSDVMDDGYKFIVVGDTLVIGDVNDHTVLLAIHMFGLSDELVDWYLERMDDSEFIRRWRMLIQKGTVTAAGSTSICGIVMTWDSLGFRLETPEALRPQIEQIIRQEIRSRPVSMALST